MKRRVDRVVWFVAVVVCAAPGRAQEQSAAPAAPEPVTQERVTELVTWLASDERMGRDSPSPGLAAAAAWLRERFAAAGLEPPRGGEFEVPFDLPGRRLDARELVLTVAVDNQGRKQKVELAGETDVRILRPGVDASGSDERATVARAGDPRIQQLLSLGGGRRAIAVEVPVDSPVWQRAAGAHDLLDRRMRGAAPVFLVRAGALPDPGPTNKPGTNVLDTPRAEVAPTWSLSWQGLSAEAVQVGLANLVGVRRGTVAPDEYVIVSAHYDHIGLAAGVAGDVICNGADDDASGTTAVVAIAEALARRPKLRRSVAFVCFAAEEQGLKGSRAFAERPPFPLAGVVADINIEMIGRPEQDREHAAWITGTDYSDFAALVAPALQRAGIALVEFPMAKQLFAASDNLSLARKGVVAHSISAGSLHEDYHRPGDEVGKLDLEHMTAVIRGLVEVVVDLADGEARPAWNDAGKAFLESVRGN